MAIPVHEIEMTPMVIQRPNRSHARTGRPFMRTQAAAPTIDNPQAGTRKGAAVGLLDANTIRQSTRSRGEECSDVRQS